MCVDGGGVRLKKFNLMWCTQGLVWCTLSTTCLVAFFPFSYQTLRLNCVDSADGAMTGRETGTQSGAGTMAGQGAAAATCLTRTPTAQGRIPGTPGLASGTPEIPGMDAAGCHLHMTGAKTMTGIGAAAKEAALRGGTRRGQGLMSMPGGLLCLLRM